MLNLIGLMMVLISVGNQVSIADLLQNPKKFTGKEVSIQGVITDVCQNSGCWIEVKQGEASIIVKSVDHKILFPKDCVGKAVSVTGFLRSYAQDECEGDHMETKDHECPEPQYFIEVTSRKIMDSSTTPER